MNDSQRRLRAELAAKLREWATMLETGEFFEGGWRQGQGPDLLEIRQPEAPGVVLNDVYSCSFVLLRKPRDPEAE